MRITHALAAVTVAFGLVLTGCGDDDDNGDATAPEFNDADIEFAQGMIPHHEQAIEMAEMARDRASDPDVVELAGDIEAAQGPEIETMQGWLEDWGAEDEMQMDGSEMDHDMGGMMSEGQMSELESASGSAFDRTFLTLMIEHHEGAIEMAQTEQADGENADAIELAEQIEASQTREIDQMEAMLAQ